MSPPAHLGRRLASQCGSAFASKAPALSRARPPARAFATASCGPSAPRGNRFLDRVASGETIICAEGYLFELERRGYVQVGPFVPEVTLRHPEVVRGLHMEFARAGSDIVEAFTYYANRAKLRLIGKEHILEPLNRAALRIAKDVAEETGTIMAGNICNTSSYKVGDSASEEDVRMQFREQCQWAAEEGAELIIGETFDHFGEAVIALDEIKRVGLPPVITFALANWTDGSKKGDRLLLQDDVGIVDACQRMHDDGAVVVGLNCHYGPNTILKPLAEIRKATNFPLAALPVGYRCTDHRPTMQELSAQGKTYTDLDPHTCTRDDFGEFATACRDLGVQYVGTCCGGAAHHVRAMAMALGRQPDAAATAPDLTKHFVFGSEAVLNAAGNLRGTNFRRAGAECGAEA
uniref:Hcy-binding domain-containing protein n=1 Tax=Zooxanthella nutricula TaxID=1333877 RepID=A0A7S2L0P0_9DINO